MAAALIAGIALRPLTRGRAWPKAERDVQSGRTEDDEPVVLAFSSPERSAECLGDEQLWVTIPQTQPEEFNKYAVLNRSRSILGCQPTIGFSLVVHSKHGIDRLSTTQEFVPGLDR